MASYPVAIRKKGQLTLPSDLRRDMGWGEGDTVMAIKEGDQVVLVRPATLVARLYGSLSAYANPENAPRDIQEIIDDEREWLAQSIADEGMETLERIK